MTAVDSEMSLIGRARRNRVARYGTAALGVLVAFLIRQRLDPILEDRAALELFLVSVAFAAWFGGFGPALTATVLSAVVGNWAFIPPRRALWIEDPSDRVEAAAFIFAAVSISWLVRSLRLAQDRAEQSAALAREKEAELAGQILVREKAEKSARRLAEESDQRRRELEVVLDTAPVAIWVAHDRDCRQVTGNRLAHKLFGDWEGNAAVLLSRGGVEVRPEERPLARAARVGMPTAKGEFELVGAKGRRVSLLSIAAPFVGEAKDVRGAVSVWADVTALKQAEEEVSRLNSDLEQRVETRTGELRRALDELTAYAYSIAHNLRAPLRAVASYTQILVEESGPALPAQGSAYAALIIEAARRMDEMILDLLRYSRISRESFRVEEVDPYLVCREVIGRFADDLRRCSGEVVVNGPMDRITGNRELLAELFSQFLSNAIKFVSAGVAARIRIWSETAEGRVRVCVEDNGIGIAPEYREQIFGAFQRLHADDVYPGTGMGLAIVRRAAERMEGRCWAESEPGGKGSRFWVELPSASAQGAGSAAPGRGKSFLKY